MVLNSLPWVYHSEGQAAENIKVNYLPASGLKRVGSEIKPLITISPGVRELLLEVPLGLLWHRLLLPLAEGWGLEHEG